MKLGMCQKTTGRAPVLRSASHKRQESPVKCCVCWTEAWTHAYPSGDTVMSFLFWKSPFLAVFQSTAAFQTWRLLQLKVIHGKLCKERVRLDIKRFFIQRMAGHWTGCPGPWWQPQACQSSRSTWTMLSSTGWDSCSLHSQEQDFGDSCGTLPAQDVLWFFDA